MTLKKPYDFFWSETKHYVLWVQIHNVDYSAPLETFISVGKSSSVGMNFVVLSQLFQQLHAKLFPSLYASDNGF